MDRAEFISAFTGRSTRWKVSPKDGAWGLTCLPTRFFPCRKAIRTGNDCRAAVSAANFLGRDIALRCPRAAHGAVPTYLLRHKTAVAFVEINRRPNAQDAN